MHVSADNSPQDWCLIFHHLKIKGTTHYIHFNRNVHWINTFNLKQTKYYEKFLYCDKETCRPCHSLYTGSIPSI